MLADFNEHEADVLRVFQTKDETRAYYNKIARIYDLLAEHSEQPMREIGLARLAPQPGERIVEIGFATGHCLVELAEAVGPGGKVHGIDISDQMVSLTQNLLDQSGVADWVDLTRGDAEQLPYHDNSMDGIFTSFTLELFDTLDITIVLAKD